MSLSKRVMSLVMFGAIATVALIPGTVKNDKSVVLAAETYKVTTSINRYKTADDAESQSGSIGVYEAGDYYIYKEHNGMLNISKYPGGPGSWINTSENGSSSAPVVDEKNEEAVYTSIEKEEVEESSTKAAENESYAEYYLYSSTNVYLKASDAMINNSPVGTYEAGKYYIYKAHNGMLNISRVKGVPGAWVNPDGSSEVTTTPVTTTPKTTVAKEESKTTSTEEKFEAKTSFPKYIKASDAKNNMNPIGTYPAGTYYIYKEAYGMYNLSKTPGVPGAWMNPNSNGSVVTQPIVTKATTTAKTTSPVTTTPKTTTPAPSTNIEKITFTASIERYSTANDAENKVNSKGTYPAGTYFVYKKANAMINISATPGVPGSWVNPEESTTKTPTATKPASTTPKATFPVDYKGTSITDYAKQFVGENGYDFYTWYGLKYRDEWCAMFVSYVGNKTGNSALIPKYSYVDHYTDYYKQFNNITVGPDFVPTKDMLILFDWQPNGYSDHIGIVDYSDGEKVYTIEGNSNDRVEQNSYDIDSENILGYLLPGYPGAKVNGKEVPGGAFIKRLVE